MFNFCSALTSLDVSYFRTNNVENMENMFSYCSKIKILDLSKFETKEVRNM
jgi:surface protein